MPFIQTTLPIPLDGTGTEIPALNITDSYELYEITGTVVSIGNYAIVPTGTPQNGTTFLFDYNGALDITTNGNTFSIFGVALNQTQLLSKLKITCRYNGSAWKVTVVGSLDQAVITTTSITPLAITTSLLGNNSVTNAKLAQMADLTFKGNISGGLANPSDVPISSLSPYISGFWSTTGNAGLTAGTNFIGTTDAVDLVFKVNGIESGRISNSGVLYNTSLGKYAFISNTIGGSNVAIGSGALTLNTSGNQNVAVGSDALGRLTTSDNNIGIGAGALSFVTTGVGNIGIGVAGTTLTIGSNNTIIGDGADVSSATSLNRIALGYGASATSDYQFTIPTNITTVEFGKAVITTGTNIQKRNTTAANATATLTAAQVHVGYITSTSAAPTTLTLPTGTLLGAELGATQGTIFKLYIDNTAGSSTVTIAVAVDGILSANAAANAASFGLLTIPADATGIAEFTIMFNSSTKYVFSRTA